MSKSIIVEGKTTSEAIEKGLKELNVTRNMVEIKTIEEEKKRSFYSILSPRVVKIEITVKENIEIENNQKRKKYVNTNLQEIEKSAQKIKEVFEKMFGYMKCDVKIEDYVIKVNIEGENMKELIGYRGATINALQVLATAIASKNASSKIMVIVDVGNYRAKREKTLEELADKISKTVIKTKKAVSLEPMTAYERKIIHMRLQNHDKVKTFSKGEEPRRRIVIALK